MEARPFSDISYEQFLSEEKLMGSKCKKCGSVYAPPRPVCIKCGSYDMDWVEMKGTGKLYAFTCIAIAPPAMAAEGYGRNNPYCSGVVQLDEGPRVDARIEGVNTRKPETIQVGTPMRVKFLHRGSAENRTTSLAFEPR